MFSEKILLFLFKFDPNAGKGVLCPDRRVVQGRIQTLHEPGDKLRKPASLYTLTGLQYTTHYT